VAAIPPAALVLSVELLVMIVRRAAIARTARLAAAAATGTASTVAVARSDPPTTSMVVVGDRPTTTMTATGERLALPATTGTDRHAAGSHDHDHATSSQGDRQRQATSAPAATGDQPTTTPPRRRASGDHTASGATYQRVRELYVGGVTVAAEIARELGVSASYAQRTLRRVKGDLARQQPGATAGDGRVTTPERADEATSDHHQEREAARSPDHPPAPDHQATSRDQATRDGDGRTTTVRDRHLALVAPDRDQDRGETER
jgi:hypothetical protein